jgi:DNA (cytosine-5)-methyltransferase 1
MRLVLSLFPGIGLLDMAFEESGFCVVRGPDIIWGGDVKRFHAPRGRFDGVIGGPPCKAFSPLANINLAQGRELAENLIPEYERIVAEAAPAWFIMENVRRAPKPHVPGYLVTDLFLNNRWVGGEQNRMRRFSFGTPGGVTLYPETEALEPIDFEPAVTSTSGGRRAVVVYDDNGRVRGKQGHADNARLRGRSIGRMLELQGLPPDHLKDCPLTQSGMKEAIGNGVPLPMGRAIARAVKAAMYEEAVA